MVDSSQKPLSAREASKQKNRELLLQATMRAIHHHGLKGATIDVIQQYSGLGRGMINQHFSSKDGLIWTVAERMVNDYKNNWQTALREGGNTAIEKFHAICQSEFSEAVLTPQKAAIWFSFRAEAYASPQYHTLIGSGDSAFGKTVTDLCREICASDPAADPDPEKVGRVLSAFFEGMWTAFHLEPEAFDRDAARDLALDVARKYMPSV